MVAELMALSARTAPKGRGQDSIVIKVIAGEELQTLSRELRRLGEARGIKFYLRDAGNLEKSEACVLLASKVQDHVGLDCGGCGFATCLDMLQAQKQFSGEGDWKNPSAAPTASSRWRTWASLWALLPRLPACTMSTIVSCSLRESLPSPWAGWRAAPWLTVCH